MWTARGLKFGWAYIGEINGDQFLALALQCTKLGELTPTILTDLSVSELAIWFIDRRPYLSVNGSMLVDPSSGQVKSGVSQCEAQRIARRLSGTSTT